MGNHNPKPRAKGTVSRRDFIAGAAKSAGGVCAAGFALSLYAESAGSQPVQALRPPGAIAEEDFQSACVRCGLCVRACPYDTLKLAEFGDDVALGTPFFVARDVPCFMCPDVPCARACPTGALDAEIPSIKEATMGTAVLSDHENCLNYRGMHCSVCHRVCPIRDEAITLEKHVINGKPRLIPTVHSDHCTGCGRCEEQCVLAEAAIRVYPVDIARGSIGVNRAGRRI
ncbi:ferredoxin-type protein NapG [Indioceanicola profundi]|uniref:ferredoxin-type protein NapG n=1 Tax=Indioceanicola profundi TaxID=2220096 RepID=UPI000E6AE036|nr:ferredoxin-type protein NapG [Indioceanicola profundi]